MNNLTGLTYIDGKREDILAVSHKIWDYAELSLKEYKSAALYVEALKNEGFSVTEKLCGIDTAFCGSYGSGAPVIGILGEFDALSGLSQEAACAERKALKAGEAGHGCGHNMLGAASFGAALGVKHYLEETGLPGTVIFFGCPGEEGGASKALMAREWLWKSLDAALTWHPGDCNDVSAGSCNSTVQALYSFRGVASHAAGDPEHGRSALDAVELMNVGVQFLREHMDSGARIHYSILDTGGPSPNVVQPTASVLYMIRSNKVKDVLALEARVDKIAEGAALMTETSFEKTFVDGCSDTVYNPVLQQLLQDKLNEVPLPEYSEEELKLAADIKASYDDFGRLPGLGAQHDEAIAAFVKAKQAEGCPMNNYVMPLYTGYHFSPGSTDVGDVSHLTPVAEFNAAAWPSGCPGHSWQNVACGNSPLGDKAVIYAAKVLCSAVCELMTDSGKMEAVKAAAGYLENEYFCPVPPGAKLLVI